MSTDRDVFINCPFDPGYQLFFRAIVFVVIRSGFRARCALETDDTTENRFEKICKIINDCRYAIHDISRTELDRKLKLPRFNISLELGIFLGAKRFGSGTHRSKRCIVLDRERYRYQKYISDIAGHDIHSHNSNLNRLMEKVASWLRDQSRDPKIPGGRKMVNEFGAFQKEIRKICARRDLHPDELTFGDYTKIVSEYLTAPAGCRRVKKKFSKTVIRSGGEQ
jgi:hypothetical protein